MKEYLNPNRQPKEKVEVDKEFLTEVAGFLLASSRYEDEGRLPYSSFKNASHYLATVLSDILNERIHGRECYDLYDKAVGRYENDPVVVEFYKELDELFKSCEER